MKRAEIVAEARRYVEAKTPWRMHGRSERGLNCSGLIAVVGEKFGLEQKGTYEGSIVQPDGKQLLSVLTQSLIATQPPLKPGMVALFQNVGSPLHLAIIGELHDHPSLIHVGADRRHTSEESLSKEMARHLFMVFDFPGVED